MTNLKRLIKNIFSLGVASVISRIISALIVIYLVRVLSPSAFGTLNFAQSIIAFITMACQFSIDQIGIRDVSKDNENWKTSFSAVILIKAAQTIAACCLLIMLLLIVNRPFDEKVLVLLFSFTCLTSILSLDWFFTGIEKMEFVGMAGIAINLLSAALIYTFIKSQAQLIYIPAIQIISALAAYLLICILFLRKYENIKLVLNWKVLKDSFKTSLISGSIFILNQLLFTFDIVMLNFFHPAYVVGYYSAAYKIVLFFLAPYLIYNLTIFPMFSRFFNQSKEKLGTLINYTIKAIPATSLLIVITSFFAAKPLLGTLFGDKYLHSIPFFNILIFSLFILSLDRFFGIGLFSAGFEKILFRIFLCATSSNLILNVLLIPKYGATGASIAIIISELIGVISSFLMFKKYVFDFSLSRQLIRPGAASIVLIIYFIFFSKYLPHVILQVLAGIMAYGFTLYALGYFQKNEIDIIRNLYFRKANS